MNPSTYVFLERSFAAYAPSDVEGTRSWSDLLRLSCVVILGEAGTGKTTELREQADRLERAGEFSVRLPLVDVARDGLDPWVDPEQFADWLRSDRVGYFFLDALDEARLEAATLEAAVRRLRGALGSQLDRTHFVFTSRISDWRGADDIVFIDTLLPAPARPGTAGRSGGRRAPAGDAPLKTVVVSLAPLLAEQVQTLAAALGVTDPAEFIAAIERNHAQAFAARPRDVVRLLSYWQEHGRLGTLTELLEHDVLGKLGEDNHGRAMATSLSPSEARRAAETLAAACMLGRTFEVRLPGCRSELGRSATAIRPEEVLADFPPNRVEALLSRALFDEATYGRARFHHRAVQEYLAACWLRGLRAAGLPDKELLDLLFDRKGDDWVLIPSLAAAAGWLGGWDDAVRRALFSHAPHILIDAGDPSALPVVERGRLLREWLTRGDTDPHVWRSRDRNMLERFADPRLGPTIAALLSGGEVIAPEARRMLLQLAGSAQMTECLPQALLASLNYAEDSTVRHEAIRAVSRLGDQGVQRTLVEALLSGQPIPTSVATALLTSFFPHALGPGDLCKLADANEPESDFGESNLAWALVERTRATFSPESAYDTAHALLRLWQNRVDALPPTAESQPRDWVLSALAELVALATELTGEDPAFLDSISGCLSVLSNSDSRRRNHLSTMRFREALAKHAGLRRACMRLQADLLAAETGRRPTRARDLLRRADLQVGAVDVGWLLVDAQTLAVFHDRLFALDLALTIGAPDDAGRLRIAHIAAADPRMDAHIRRHAERRALVMPEPWEVRRFREDRAREMRLARQRRDDRHYLLLRLPEIEGGTAVRLLAWLRDQMPEKSRDSWAQTEWRALAPLFGDEVAEATRAGLKNTWRTFHPMLPHENPSHNSVDGRVSLGLSGLGIEFADGRDPSTLSPAEVDLAARYAVNELNRLPAWLTSLATAHRPTVQAVLVEELDAEMMWNRTEPPPQNLAQRIGYSDPPVQEILVARALEVLAFPGCNPSIEGTVLAGLDHAGEHNFDRIAKLQLARRSDVESFGRWWPRWFGGEPDEALRVLADWLDQLGGEARSGMEAVLASLDTGRMPPISVRPLERLVHLAYTHVRPDEDLVRRGVYSPGRRDAAQRTRERLLGALADVPGKDAIHALRRLAGLPAASRHERWLRDLILRRRESDAETVPWTPARVLQFARHHECDPPNAAALFALVVGRLEAVAEEIRSSDHSYRALFRPDTLEYEVQKWLASHLSLTSRGRYRAVREEEIDQAHRPDIRVWGRPDEVVGIEVKRAHRWGYAELEAALRDQLVGQYLRAANARHGILLLANLKPGRRWRPKGRRPISFPETVKSLNELAASLSQTHPSVEQVLVIGIDFTPPATS